jgi:hypothetical protein
MIRNLRSVMALTVCGVLAAVVASANVPVPSLSNVPRCLQLHPTAGPLAAQYKVTILGTGGPINAAAVQIRMITVGDTLVCWCNTPSGPRPYVFQQSTNGSGFAAFTILGGGCIQYGLAAIPGSLDYAGEVYADGVRMQEFGTVSSDAVDNTGKRATDAVRWNPAGVCAAGLADAVEHTNPLALAQYDYCTDFNCDNATGLADGTIVTPFLSGAASCAGASGP